MPSFHTEVPHQLGQEQATERLKGFLETVRTKYQDQVSRLEGEWEGNVLKFGMTAYMISMDGSLTVEDSRVVLDGNLPFAAMAFKGKIQQSISAALEQALQG